MVWLERGRRTGVQEMEEDLLAEPSRDKDLERGTHPYCSPEASSRARTIAA
jgi:hypothetical protein